VILIYVFPFQRTSSNCDTRFVRQEQYSVVVFQFAEEHRDKAIASQIIGRSLLEENISFFQEKNCVPMASGLEDSRESVFQFRCIEK
jgi:hypothetical protein